MKQTRLNHHVANRICLTTRSKMANGYFNDTRQSASQYVFHVTGEKRENCMTRKNGGKKIIEKYGPFNGTNSRIVVEILQEVYKFPMVITTYSGLLRNSKFSPYNNYSIRTPYSLYTNVICIIHLKNSDYYPGTACFASKSPLNIFVR